MLGLASSIQLVMTSRPLVDKERFAIACAAVQKELDNTGLVLRAAQEEGEMQRLYGAETPTYSPEVIDELRDSLEALWDEVATQTSQDTSTSTNRKSLYMAVVSLLNAGKSETFIIEEVLQQKGRNYKKGQEMLQDLLDKGEKNEW